MQHIFGDTLGELLGLCERKLLNKIVAAQFAFSMNDVQSDDEEYLTLTELRTIQFSA